MKNKKLLQLNFQKIDFLEKINAKILKWFCKKNLFLYSYIQTN